MTQRYVGLMKSAAFGRLLLLLMQQKLGGTTARRSGGKALPAAGPDDRPNA
jgi:hypothetical protein